jgi:transcriptional regulator with XRE-family HTH domain
VSQKTVKIRGKALKQLRIKRALSQRELGEMIKLSETRIAHLERGENSGMYLTSFRQLAEVLKMSIEDLKGQIGVVEELDQNVDPYSERKVPRIPTFDMSVAAGHWIDISEFGEVREPGMIDHGFFRIRIRGDSMQPKYKTDDIVEFRCMRDAGAASEMSTRPPDELEVGANYYIQKADDTATFKQLTKIEEETLTFRAINQKKYKEPFVVARAEIVRMARAMGKYVPD